MTPEQFRYNANKANKEADRLTLKGLKYSGRLKVLQDIAPKYGVNIFAPDAEQHEANVRLGNKAKLVRKCPHHGKSEVLMGAFVVRGNFACPKCINDMQSNLFSKLGS